MFLEKFFKTQKYYHHDGSHHSHHQDNTGNEVATKKSGTREIKVVRRVLDINEKMAEQNRRIFSAKGSNRDENDVMSTLPSDDAKYGVRPDLVGLPAMHGENSARHFPYPAGPGKSSQDYKLRWVQPD